MIGVSRPSSPDQAEEVEIKDEKEVADGMHSSDEPTEQSDTPPTLASLGRSSRRRSSRIRSGSVAAVNGNYLPFILDFDPRTIAVQFAIIEQATLRTVPWTDLFKTRDWTSYNKEIPGVVAEARSGVLALIDRFNQTCQWVASEIVCTQKLELRARVIETFIEIAKESYLLKNFSTLMEIMLGLQNPSIERLTRTWARVSAPHRKAFQHLQAFVSPLSKFKPLREEMARIADNHGGDWSSRKSSQQSIGLPSRGAVPFTGLYLGDIVQILELPIYCENPDSKSAHVHTSTKEVNFERMRTLASVLRRFRAFQDPALAYNLEPDHSCFSLVTFLKTLENVSVRVKSRECEPDSSI
ncbi:Guanine nucleotide exchange factor lte1 [Phlyctochytrium bullatum]|nr:Guanine nucleotide exchange factor lte1 [Phlyctochytrium bullatum]